MLCCCFGVWLPVYSVLNCCVVLQQPAKKEVLRICFRGLRTAVTERNRTGNVVWLSLGYLTSLTLILTKLNNLKCVMILSLTV